MNIKPYLWILPFLSFFLGYTVISRIIGARSVKTPTLLGLDITAASKLLSDANLNLRIIDQKVDTDLPDNLIIQQTPKPDQTIKANQSVFCVITKRPPHAAAPNLLQRAESELNTLADNAVRITSYRVPSIYTEGTCIGQFPKPKESLQDKVITAYVAHNPNSQALFPKVIGKTVQEVFSWLQPYGFKKEVIHRKTITHTTDTCDCIIIDQKPLAGTIVDIKKTMLIQLIV